MSDLTDFRVAVLATDGFEESELMEPVKALKDAGAQVTILSLKPGQIQGVRHDLDKTVTVKVDRAIGNVSAEDFDAVHLPGGTVNADSLRMVSEVQSLLRAMQDAGKPIAAICHGPQVLASAGLLRGKQVAAWPELRKEMEEAGAIFVDEALVEDDAPRRPLEGGLDAQDLRALAGLIIEEDDRGIADAGEGVRDVGDAGTGEERAVGVEAHTADAAVVGPEGRVVAEDH